MGGARIVLLLCLYLNRPMFNFALYISATTSSCSLATRQDFFLQRITDLKFGVNNLSIMQL